MDLILRNIGFWGPRIKSPMLASEMARLLQEPVTSQPMVRPSMASRDGVAPGFIETDIHLDKSCIDCVNTTRGDLEEAIGEVAKAKATFTPEDVYARAKRTLEKAILQGTTHMRTHLEVDPGIGLRGLEGVLPLIKEYSWAIDLAKLAYFPRKVCLTIQARTN